MTYDIEQIASAWKDNRQFANWLMQRLRPDVVVDLGVDCGYSTFCFAEAGIGRIIGIDHFQGDPHVMPNPEAIGSVKSIIQENHYDNIEIIVSDHDAAAGSWTLPIDILHIDGAHSYAATKSNYETWKKFVKESGVILFHDTVVFDEVRQVFQEVDMHKVNFTLHPGLGVASRDPGIINEIRQQFGDQVV